MIENNSKNHNVFDSNRLSHAYIVTSDALADKIAMAVVCSARDRDRPCMVCADCNKASRHIHPDITKIGKLDGKHIVAVDQIRELKQDVLVVPNDAMQKAYVIEDADTMNNSAQNALLQVLEEPPTHAVFILISENPAMLLPTVRSRCIETICQSVNDFDNTENDPELIELCDNFIEAISEDNIKLMECMFHIGKLDRFALDSFISLARENIVLSLKNAVNSNDENIRSSLANADSVLAEAGEMQKVNVSPGHISGFICASILY